MTHYTFEPSDTVDALSHNTNNTNLYSCVPAPFYYFYELQLVFQKRHHSINFSSILKISIFPLILIGIYDLSIFALTI